MPYLNQAQADEVASFHCISLQWAVNHGDLDGAKAKALINDELLRLRAFRDGGPLRGLSSEDPEFADAPLERRVEVADLLRAYEDAVAHLDAITRLVSDGELAVDRAIRLLTGTRRELRWLATDGPVWPVANPRVFRARRAPEDIRPTAFERVMQDDDDEEEEAE